VTPIPRSYAATSNAQRVRVEVFSKIRTMFFPRRLGAAAPERLSCLSFAARSRRWTISSAV